MENNLRGDGFALCNCILNLIGNFPASYVYSIISDLFSKNLDKKEQYKSFIYALIISMGYNFIGFIFILIAGVFRFKIKGDLSNDKINIDDRTSIDKLNESQSESQSESNK